MSDDIYDDPDLKVGGDYIKFEKEGDETEGEVLRVSKFRFDDGRFAPQILLRTPDGEEVNLTAGQIQLHTLLSEKRPRPGDYVKVTMSRIEKRAGGKTLKHFTLDVYPAGQGRPGQPSAANI